MNLILFKSEDQIIREGIERLDKTELNVEGSSGKVARLLLNIVNSILGDENGVYQMLRVNHLNAFLSTASDEYLDSIAMLMNLIRYNGEDDEAFRYRISNATTSLAKANETSIRLAALSVDGVQDIVLKEHTHGTGSFSIYVISEYAVNPDGLEDLVYSVIDNVRSYGTKFKVLNPIIKDVKLNLNLKFNNNVSEIDKDIISNDVKALVIDYINSLVLGSQLDIYRLRYDIINFNSNIIDAIITSMKIDDVTMFVTNQQTKWNERFIASSEEGSIIITRGE